MKKQLFCSRSIEELALWLKEKGQPSFRAKQIFEWVYQKKVASFDEMTSLSKELRTALAEDFAFPGIERIRVQDSGDGETFKSLWRLPDGKFVESVLICSGQRRTVCVSSQVGCPARCAFCASGKEGLMRNLEFGEILEQVLHTDRDLREKGEFVSHIVFMGMGEPLKNLDAVLRAVHALNDPAMFNISQRRITVSTVGVTEGIDALRTSGLRVNLVLSLHAPNQHLRKKIIPYARQYELSDLMTSMDEYASETHRDVTYEYILLAGLNDQPEHAEELAKLIGRRQATVNLIPYNPVPGLRLKKPSADAVRSFREVLARRRIVNTCRYTKGDDIAAACGQLALQQ